MRYIYVSLIAIMFLSCKQKPKAPDVSNIKVDVKIQRFDKDFFDTSKPIAEKLIFLKQKYGIVYDLYMYNTGIASGLETGLKPEIIAGKYIEQLRPLFDSVMKKYNSYAELETEFIKALQYYKYYFPEKNTPTIFSLLLQFPSRIEQDVDVTGTEFSKDTLLIYPQLFMGKNFSIYDPTIYADYLRERFDKKYIVRNSLLAMLKGNYEPIANDAPVVEQMIDQGKRIYVLDKLMPTLPDYIKVGYTQKQLSDCKAEEKKIWTFFIDNNYLFSSDPQNNRDFNNDGPSTRELGEGSPGNIGAFVGWQIVKKYMEQNEKMSLDELMKKDAKQIYQDAKYKP